MWCEPEDDEYEPIYCKKCDDHYDAALFGSCPTCSKKFKSKVSHDELQRIMDAELRSIYVGKIKNIKGE